MPRVSLGAPVVELHAGAYCEAAIAGHTPEAEHHLKRIKDAAAYGASLGLEVHAGPRPDLRHGDAGRRDP